MMIDTTGQDARASHEVVKAPMDKDADRIAATVAMFPSQYKLKAGPESAALIPPGRAKKNGRRDKQSQNRLEGVLEPMYEFEDTL